MQYHMRSDDAIFNFSSTCLSFWSLLFGKDTCRDSEHLILTDKHTSEIEFLPIDWFVFSLTMRSISGQQNKMYLFLILRDCCIGENAINLTLTGFAKSDFMFTLACEQALYFWVRNYQPINTLKRQISLGKKIQ